MKLFFEYRQCFGGPLDELYLLKITSVDHAASYQCVEVDDLFPEFLAIQKNDHRVVELPSLHCPAHVTGAVTAEMGKSS